MQRGCNNELAPAPRAGRGPMEESLLGAEAATPSSPPRRRPPPRRRAQQSSQPPAAAAPPAARGGWVVAGYFVLVAGFLLVAASVPGRYETQFCDEKHNRAACFGHLGMPLDGDSSVRCQPAAPLLPSPLEPPEALRWWNDPALDKPTLKDQLRETCAAGEKIAHGVGWGEQKVASFFPSDASGGTARGGAWQTNRFWKENFFF